MTNPTDEYLRGYRVGAEDAKKIAQDYCWQRYKGRQPMMLTSEAVFTSHEWQKIGEAIDKDLPDAPAREVSVADERGSLPHVIQDGTRFRHKKTGGTYIVVGAGRIEADLTPCVVYQSETDGRIWVRPQKEFNDGRFVRIE